MGREEEEMEEKELLREEERKGTERTEEVMRENQTNLYFNRPIMDIY